MDINEFIFQIIILLTPGSLSLFIIKRFTTHRRESKVISSFNDLLAIIILTFISCIVLDIIMFEFLPAYYISSTKKMLTNSTYSYIEFTYLLCISSIMGIISSIYIEKKLDFKLLKWLHISNHFGEDDVWLHFNQISKGNWVNIRDHKLDLIYCGYIEQYSDPGEIRELLISDVTVYSNIKNSDFKSYCIPKLYLSRNFDDFTIEFIKMEKTDVKKE